MKKGRKEEIKERELNRGHGREMRHKVEKQI